jgi:hypothetical protein
MNSVEDLDVFKLAHQLALRIYSVPKSFPGEETYSLVDQMRRAFREFILLSGWNDLNGSRANAATWRLSVSPGGLPAKFVINGARCGKGAPVR